MISTNIIILWLGTNATIPSGFSRVTDLDGYYIKGVATAATNPSNTAAGADTHTHTSSAHSHTMNSHGHVVTVGDVAGNTNTNQSGSEGAAHHTHTDTIYGVVDGGLSSVTSTYAAFSNAPVHYEVIFIKATARRTIPDDAALFWYEEDPPTGFNVCNGDGGVTPDLGGMFLKGAAAGGNAGVPASQGTTTNIHTLTHTHVETAHTHYYEVDTGGNMPDGCGIGVDGSNMSKCTHRHRYRLNGTSAGGISGVSLTTTEIVQPAYIKISVIRNTSGFSKVPKKGVIAIWTGTIATIPVGWKICDGNNGTPNLLGKYLKVVNLVSEIGNTGGSNTHTHASQSHTHTGSSHNHTSSSTDDDFRHNILGVRAPTGGSFSVVSGDSVHSTSVSVSSVAVAWASANTTADSSSNEPQYKTVAFIYLKNPPTGMMQDA